MFYLASPYWHIDPEIREWRYKAVTQAASYLIHDRRACIYSPITHNVPISKLIEEKFNCKSGSGEELGHEFWVHIMDFPILRKCDGLLVLRLQGWEVSRGVSEEILVAETIKIPIEYLRPITDASNNMIGVL